MKKTDELWHLYCHEDRRVDGGQYMMWDDFLAALAEYGEAVRAEAEGLRKNAERQWVGLTDEEIKDIVGRNDPDGVGRYTRELFRKIEAKLKEKNG